MEGFRQSLEDRLCLAEVNLLPTHDDIELASPGFILRSEHRRIEITTVGSADLAGKLRREPRIGGRRIDDKGAIRKRRQEIGIDGPLGIRAGEADEHSGLLLDSIG